MFELQQCLHVDIGDHDPEAVRTALDEAANDDGETQVFVEPLGRGDPSVAVGPFDEAERRVAETRHVGFGLRYVPENGELHVSALSGAAVSPESHRLAFEVGVWEVADAGGDEVGASEHFHVTRDAVTYALLCRLCDHRWQTAETFEATLGGAAVSVGSEVCLHPVEMLSVDAGRVARALERQVLDRTGAVPPNPYPAFRDDWHLLPAAVSDRGGRVVTGLLGAGPVVDEVAPDVALATATAVASFAAELAVVGPAAREQVLRDATPLRARVVDLLGLDDPEPAALAESWDEVAEDVVAAGTDVAETTFAVESAYAARDVAGGDRWRVEAEAGELVVSVDDHVPADAGLGTRRGARVESVASGDPGVAPGDEVVLPPDGLLERV